MSAPPRGQKMVSDDILRGQELVNKLAEKVTLRMFRVGCDEKNFDILKKLPLTAAEIEVELGLTPMPVNKRISDLREAGLVFREKAGAEIELTALGKDLLDHVEKIKEEVIDAMAERV